MTEVSSSRSAPDETAQSAPAETGRGPELGDLPGLDPAWSRMVTAPDAEGRQRQWHVLDNGVEPTHGTLLCIHGNPTWSYLWRGLLAAAPAGWRVIAPDHLGMGFSERPDAPRTVAQRVADLGALTDALGVTGPVVTVGHDWGGILSLGWALAHRDQLRGVIVGNTAVAQPEGDLGPPLIRLAHLPGLRSIGCVATPLFVRGTTALSRPALPPEICDALALPYDTVESRRAVGAFVADIPFSPGHPSYEAVAELAEGVRTLDVPALMFWGPRDPVFGERYLADLLERLPHAQVHRFEGASHLVTEDAPEYADLVADWVRELDEPATTSASAAGDTQASTLEPLWAELDRRSDDTSPVVSHQSTVVSWAAMSRRVAELAAGLAEAGVRPGDRVGLLVEPSADLTSIVYAVWRAGAVIVVADKGLGFTGMRRALRGAGLDHLVAAEAGLAAGRAMGLPGTRISLRPLAPATRRLLVVDHDLDELARRGRHAPQPTAPSPDADCAVVFTSGATGPAKGVVYTHGQVRAQVDLVRATYDLQADDTYVAAFAPFALMGPALGLGSSVPDIDVTKPDTLTASLLADAAAAVDARIVFASPAALRRVVATSADLTSGQRETLSRVRLLMSAGAPVPASLLEALGKVLPNASLHTPYGMTEVLPVTDISFAEIKKAGAGEGVCVGRSLPGVEVAVEPLDATSTELTDHPEVMGEICVRAAHVKDRYDALWATERSSTRHAGWHATGDVGHLDEQGRLWVEGRRVHVISRSDAFVTPVAIEQRIEALDVVGSAAVVGVGPAGAQVVVAVVVPTASINTDATRSRWARVGRRHAMRLRVADFDLAEDVRRVAGTDVSAVLSADRLPLDIRHASKIDRTEVARQAAEALAGRGGS